jgi:hypothetical protein
MDDAIKKFEDLTGITLTFIIVGFNNSHVYILNIVFSVSEPTKVEDEEMQECDPQETEVVEMEVEMQDSDDFNIWWSKYGHEVAAIIDELSTKK